MNCKTIDTSIKTLFQKLEETGILLDEEKLRSLIHGSQKRLAEQKQAINRETGFIVNLYSEEHCIRAISRAETQDFFPRLAEARKLSFLIRRLLQVYDLAYGNYKILGRQFGLYPKYGLDLDRKIITTSELSISDLPEEAMGVVGHPGMILLKATYLDIILSVIRGLSGDPWISEATAMDLVKLGFVNLFEDYRIEKMGYRIFALADCSVYLFGPYAHVDLISSVIRECLGNAHTDFALPVNIATGVSLDKLI